MPNAGRSAARAARPLQRRVRTVRCHIPQTTGTDECTRLQARSQDRRQDLPPSTGATGTSSRRSNRRRESQGLPGDHADTAQTPSGARHSRPRTGRLAGHWLPWLSGSRPEDLPIRPPIEHAAKRLDGLRNRAFGTVALSRRRNLRGSQMKTPRQSLVPQGRSPRNLMLRIQAGLVGPPLTPSSGERRRGREQAA